MNDVERRRTRSILRALLYTSTTVETPDVECVADSIEQPQTRNCQDIGFVTRASKSEISERLYSQ